jgi:hypothetical protein
VAGAWRGQPTSIYRQVYRKSCVVFVLCHCAFVAFMGEIDIVTTTESFQCSPKFNPRRWTLNFYVLQDGRQEVKLKVTLEQATKAQRGSRGIALLFL